ncbi:MAG TPA: 3-methylcrotonyl-CoA carboxylase [Legionella sp.]|nr:3-methylcrotonyl-CoA carboxylase [Legionella sp.]
MFNKILIANRGEIACRIIKTARRLGVLSVAIYSSADRDSLHVSLADMAFCVGEPAARDSYLNIEAIIAIAVACSAEAIHPGYGFLSENPALARACAASGIVFIGPSVAALEAMGSKQLAKQMLEKTDVPLTPGYHGLDQTDARLLQESEQLGFPVLLKAASGGGGKGMRAVHHADEFAEALAGARREAIAYFADDTMLIEKLIPAPRHIEMQIMADNHGHMVHLFERDCSIQRRHQKIIEEAPAAHLSEPLREQLAKAAIAVARAIDYRGAGTIEFLVDDAAHFYFMEMNTRLQVEHPVTEMITGLDLVEWQLRIAANEPLPRLQSQIEAHGHAIECRIYAEDPRHDFLPSVGQLHFLSEPVGEGVRIDSGVTAHAEVSMHYDPMIAKLITWGDTRMQARSRMLNALNHYHIGGVKTNIPFLQAILKHPRFINDQLNIDFLTEEPIEISTPLPRVALIMAACIDYLALASPQHDDLRSDTFAWQMHLHSHWSAHYNIQGDAFAIQVWPRNAHQVAFEIDGITTEWRIKTTGNQLTIDDGMQRLHAVIEEHQDQTIVYTESEPVIVSRRDHRQTAIDHATSGGQLTAPMPGTVVAILKQIGDSIKAGEALMVLEAMKMEHAIHAPTDGVVKDIFYDLGAQVMEGAQLVALEKTPI